MTGSRGPVLALSAALLLGGFPARAETRAYVPPPCPSRGASDASALLACFAPVLVSEGAENDYNRIGTPAVERGRRLGLWEHERVVVDPSHPTLYAGLRDDRSGSFELLHLVYRFHFERVPLRASRHFYEAHRNPGLLVLVTLDARDRTPLFVTTVHTCGCYRALLPTLALPRASRPSGWPTDVVRVYGETLPAILAAPRPGRDRLIVHLSSGRHRVTHLEVREDPPPNATLEDLPLAPLDSLHALPAPDGSRRSFFHETGFRRGRVRGAWNAWEGLTLFGLMALDPTAGTDKAFGDPAETGTPFYTSLRFWKHEVSRLDRFGPLLGELGFRLDPPQTRAGTNAPARLSWRPHQGQ